MGHFIKLTGSVALFGFVMMLLLKGSIADGLHEALHNEVQMTALSASIPSRSLLEGNNASPLAATVRVDPLDKLRKYRGGYNISNKHYWSSTIFTGKSGYTIAALWLLAGVVYGLFRLTSLCCINKKRGKPKRPVRSEQWFMWSMILGVLFAVLAISASVAVLASSSRFHSRAKTVRNIVIKTAEEASETIYNVTGIVKSMQDNALVQDSTGRLNSTVQRLDQRAAHIERQAKKNKRWVDKGLKILYITTVVVVSANLIAVLALSVSGFFRLRRALYLFIILCWLFTVLCWLYFGAYFFIEKFASDTCTALVQYDQNPSNSSLSLILPCNELRSSKRVLISAKKEIHDLINQVNANISATPIRICNPFSGQPHYSYQPEKCSNNTIRIGDIPQLLERLPQQGQFISASNLSTIKALTSSTQNLMNAIPGMERLVDCGTVKDAISKILLQQCKPVKKNLRMIWAAMVVLSTTMIVLVLTWTTKAHHDRDIHFSDSSVRPQSTPTETSEPEINITDGKPTETKLEA